MGVPTLSILGTGFQARNEQEVTHRDEATMGT